MWEVNGSFLDIVVPASEPHTPLALRVTTEQVTSRVTMGSPGRARRDGGLGREAAVAMRLRASGQA